MLYIYILITVEYKDNLDCYSVLFLFFRSPSSWKVPYIIQFPSDHLDPTLVGFLNPYLSIFPIRHPLWLSVSCGDQGSTVQESSPHKCGQKSSCSAFNMVVAAFPYIFFGFPFFSYVHEARPYRWSFLKGHPNCWSTYLSCLRHIQGGVPPRTTFHSFLTHETLKWNP